MMHKKIIIYGNNIELYEYEREPGLMVGGGRRTGKANSSGESIRADGQDTFSQGQLGRRQDNARRASLVFRRIVSANLSRSEPPLLITITYKENITDISVGYKNFRSFAQALRNKYGKFFKYICVPEFQKRGAVHFHALFWRLPQEVFLQERSTRTIAGIWRKGFVYIKQTDGDEKLSTYLAKYMSKAFIDPRLKNQKAYVASRNVLRPVTYSGISATWAILDQHNIDENSPVFDKSYDTKWLGTCRHRLFNIPFLEEQ